MGDIIRERLARWLQMTLNSQEARSRIETTQVLIIDEISMMSCATFDKIERVCRHIHRNSSAFGGLSVILSGLYQVKQTALIITIQ